MRFLGWCALAVGLTTLVVVILALRLTAVTDFLYHAAVKDPERTIPEGNVIVAPADGTVLYVRKITDGVIPEVVKRGVPVPVVDHMKVEPERPFAEGYLIGIYMNTQGVHLNRMPNHGVLKRQIIWNGPHMDMSDAENRVIVTALVPGVVTLKKLLGRPPFDIEDEADFVLKSARETLVIEDERGSYLYLVRIADYYVGKILTWVDEGGHVDRGQKIGMITWGSQADLFIETSSALEIGVRPGEYVYAGESVLARY